MYKDDVYLKKVLESTDNLYFKCLLNLYEIGISSYKSVAKKYAQIDATLEKYAESSSFMGSAHVNDYIGFKIEFFEKHNGEILKLQTSGHRHLMQVVRTLDFTDMPSGCYYLLYFLHLHRSLHDFPARNPSIVRKEAEGEAFNAQEMTALKENYRNYLKWKLLSSLFRGDDMGQAYIAPFIRAIDTVSLDFPDDPYELDTALKVKHRFIGALKGSKKIDTYKFLGLLAGRKKELEPGEFEYLESVTRFHDGDYEGALRYSGKVLGAHLDYGAAVAVRLECYAKTGDRTAFLDCLQNRIKYASDSTESGSRIPTIGNGASLNRYYLDLLSAQLILNLSDSDLQELENCFEDDLEAIRRCNPADYEDWGKIGTCRRLAVKILEELLEILEEDKRSADLSREFSASAQSELKKRRLFMSITALRVFPEKAMEDLKTLLDTQDSAQYDTLKDTLCHVAFDLLKDNVENLTPEEGLANLSDAALFLYRTGYVSDFLVFVTANLNHFEAHIEDKGVIEILQLAYVEFQANDASYERLTQIIDKHCAVSEETVKTAKIKSKLSPQGKKAYEFALWQYAQSQNEDYGWRDAGLISLAFFRILELEINTKIVKPLVDQISPADLNQHYTSHLNTLRGDDYRQYQTKWQNVATLIQAVNDGPAFKGMELGKLFYLFRNLTRNFDPNDPTAVYLKGIVDTIYDSTKVNIPQITSFRNRERYRNPPAHTAYLPYSVARESKVFTEDALLQLFDSIF